MLPEENRKTVFYQSADSEFFGEKLVQNGCVVLESGKGHDKQIVLTEKGKAMAKQKIIPVMEAEAGVFMHMTEEERKKLLRLNAKYMEIFRQKVGELRL